MWARVKLVEVMWEYWGLACSPLFNVNIADQVPLNKPLNRSSCRLWLLSSPWLPTVVKRQEAFQNQVRVHWERSKPSLSMANSAPLKIIVHFDGAVYEISWCRRCHYLHEIVGCPTEGPCGVEGGVEPSNVWGSVQCKKDSTKPRVEPKLFGIITPPKQSHPS